MASKDTALGVYGVRTCLLVNASIHSFQYEENRLKLS